MNNLNQVDATIEHMFDSKNDRMMLKAYCYRLYCNMTPIEVGRELRISRIKVNMLIQTIPHKRLSCGSFAIGYTLATKSIEKFVKRDVLKRHNRELSRVQARYSENLILNNQNK